MQPSDDAMQSMAQSFVACRSQQTMQWKSSRCFEMGGGQPVERRPSPPPIPISVSGACSNSRHLFWAFRLATADVRECVSAPGAPGAGLASGHSTGLKRMARGKKYAQIRVIYSGGDLSLPALDLPHRGYIHRKSKSGLLVHLGSMRQAPTVQIDGKKKAQKEQLRKTKSENQMRVLRQQEYQAKRAAGRKNRDDYRDIVHKEVNVTMARAKSLRVTK
jgi:hypothetical protein